MSEIFEILYIASRRTLSSVALAPVLGIFETTSGSRASAVLELFRFTAYLIIVFVVLLYFLSRVLENRNLSISTENQFPISEISP